MALVGNYFTISRYFTIWRQRERGGVRKYEHEPLNYYSEFWETEPLEIFRVFTKLLNWIMYIYTSE